MHTFRAQPQGWESQTSHHSPRAALFIPIPVGAGSLTRGGPRKEAPCRLKIFPTYLQEQWQHQQRQQESGKSSGNLGMLSSCSLHIGGLAGTTSIAKSLVLARKGAAEVAWSWNQEKRGTGDVTWGPKGVKTSPGSPAECGALTAQVLGEVAETAKSKRCSRIRDSGGTLDPFFIVPGTRGGNRSQPHSVMPKDFFLFFSYTYEL